MPETHQTIMARVSELRDSDNSKRKWMLWDEINDALVEFGIEHHRKGLDAGERIYSTNPKVRHA